MSTSKTPPLQPGSSQKKKRKYSNWDTHNNDGLSLRQASYRATMLAKRNDAISSNATLHVPLPTCMSNQQSHVPSHACASGQQSHVPLPAYSLSQQAHVPSPACASSKQSHLPLPAFASSQHSHVPVLASVSSQQSHVRVPARASSQQSHVPVPARASSQQSHVPVPARASSQQSHVLVPARASSQQSHVPVPPRVSSQQSHVHVPACASSQQSHVRVPSRVLNQQSHVPVPARVSSQQSHVPVHARVSSHQSHVPVPARVSSHQSHVPVPARASSHQSHVPVPARASRQQSHVPVPARASSQQSQTPINSSSYLHSGDYNLVCECCGSYFWHGECVLCFSTKRPLKSIRCCKGATSGTVAEESCSGSTITKQRSCSGQGSGEGVQQYGTKDKIKSGNRELADVQFEVSTEIHNNILPYVNKLRNYWNKGQNAVVFDGQDRLVKMVSFVSSLLDNTKKPILIIASSSARLLWEMEFLKWSKLINVVTYKGTKDTRAAIRGSEFQVLLSSPDAIVEDMETLEHINWELLVIDECQCPALSVYLKKLQMLMADMKLLTVSSEPVDILQSYRNILPLVDCNNEKIHMEMNEDIGILKERMSPFIAFECNLKRAQKETSAVKVLHIPASALIQPNSLLGSGIRLPAPHLRPSPSMFASFHKMPVTGESSLKPLPSVNYPNS